MNEKAKAQALSRARQIQPNESREIREAQRVIEENVAHEDQLYAGRGYGGYINTQHIEALRATTYEAVEKIERIRSQQATN